MTDSNGPSEAGKPPVTPGQPTTLGDTGDSEPGGVAVPASRRALLAAVGVAAMALGAGAAWAWTQRQGKGGEPVPGFWSWQWKDPQGQPVELKRFRGKPLLVNFWATWCAPCVQELPMINDFYRQHAAKGMQVVGIAVDREAAVKEFLQQKPLDFPVAVAGMSGAEVARSLGDLAGGLPFSLALNAAGDVVLRKPGALTPDDLSVLARLE